MSGLLTENFEYYGLDVTKLLQGRAGQVGAATIEVPSFEAQGRGWLHMFGGIGTSFRRSLPAGITGLGMATFFYVPAMPTLDQKVSLATIRDAGNNALVSIYLRPDGSLQAVNAAGAIVGATAGPVINASTITKMDLQASHVGGTLTVRVNDTAKMTLAAISIPGTATQIGFDVAAGSGGVDYYIKAYAVWSLTGTYNSNFPLITGVAALSPKADGALLGWTPRPRQKIGVGVLYVPTANSAIDCSNNATYDIGSGNYTLESWVRFNTLPTTVNAATLLGRWAQASNTRSYRLVKYGPGINGGNLRFEISTDGTLAGVVTVADIVWAPEIGTWYNLAVTRTAGVTRVYINGVQQGANIADAATYFAAGTTTRFALGNEFTGNNNALAGGVGMDGIFDETRITIGVGRYVANYTPTAVAYPRSVGGGDASFASVQLLIGCDLAFADESTTAVKTLGAVGAAATGRLLPADLGAQYLTLNSKSPIDDRFLESSLIAASNVLTFTGQPANAETAVLGATTYTFNTVLGGANSILIGASVSASVQNLIDAINAGPGIGVRYGTGTVINATAGAAAAPTPAQITATAITPGAAGNAIIATETIANAAWASGTTLLNGSDIPGPSEFSLQNLDPHVTGVRWIEMIDRSAVSIGAATRKKTLAVSGNTVDGATDALSTSMAYPGVTGGDIIEQDPHTAAAVTPTTLLNCTIRLTRLT